MSGRAAQVALIAPFGLHRKGTTVARVLPIARELTRQGATVRVIIPPWDEPGLCPPLPNPPPPGGRGLSRERWSQDGYEVIHTRLGTPLTTPFVVAAEISRLVREWEPDVVHAFKPIGYSGLAAWLLANRRRGAQSSRRLPLVIVDIDDLEGRAGWAGRRGQEIGGVIRGIQERLTIRAADGVTAASRWLESYGRRLGQAQVLLLPNGHSIEVTEVDGEGHAPPCPGARLLWYTRFTEANPDRFAALVAPLLREHPGLRLAILGEEVGPGDGAAARRSLENAGVSNQVDWLGYAPNGLAAGMSTLVDAVAIYPMDDDLVNRARCPSKIPQLMALGVPIVAERVGEAATYLQGLENPCLVEPGASAEFRSRVSALLKDAAARSSLSAGLRAAAVRWRWERTSDGLLDWYQQCLIQRTA